MTVFETARGQIEIRELRTMDEMVAAETVQNQVWGVGAALHPKEILIPIQFEGGLLAGAFAPDGQMVGLVFSFPSHDPTVQHSQLLATLEAWRGLGIGTQLKWFQRDWCLERGIRLVRWTVDPLRVANAELNIRHLGGIASRYLPDYYGVMQGIDAGVPSDRLLLEWHLCSEHVTALSTSTPPDQGFPAALTANEVEAGRNISSRPDLDAPGILIRLPENFIQLSKTDLAQAIDWRLQTRDLFLRYFERGFAITGFTRVGGPAYLLTKRNQDEHSTHFAHR